MKRVNSRIICADGVSLSVQGSMHHYSDPRSDAGPYYAVEVGFIEDQHGSQLTPGGEWKPFCDGSFPSDVYWYVPVDLVNAFVASHGGAVEGRMP